jgi:hypothetical protein
MFYTQTEHSHSTWMKNHEKKVHILDGAHCLLSKKRTLFFHDFFIHGGADVQFEYKIMSLTTRVRTETKFST